MATGRVDGRTVGRGRHCRLQAASWGGGGVAYEARRYKQAGQTDGQADGPNRVIWLVSITT